MLDSRLGEVGLLAEHQGPDCAMGLGEKCVVLSQTVRVATWHDTSASAEPATPRLRHVAPSTVVEPVALLSTPADRAAGQQRLALFLRSMGASDAFDADEPKSASTLRDRSLPASSTNAGRSGEVAGPSEKTSMFAAVFKERAEVVKSLQPQISHLVDVTADQEPNVRRFWQQSELPAATARMEHRGVPIRPQAAQMVEVSVATHEVSHNLGKAFRRVLLRGKSKLIDADPRHREGPAGVGRRPRLETTLIDLVDTPAPSDLVARFGHPLQRAEFPSQSSRLSSALCGGGPRRPLGFLRKCSRSGDRQQLAPSCPIPRGKVRAREGATMRSLAALIDLRDYQAPPLHPAERGLRSATRPRDIHATKHKGVG